MSWGKFIALLVVVVSISACSEAQQKNENGLNIAKEEFKKKYPNAIDIEWSNDAHGYHEASFKLNGDKFRADFTTSGSWLETEQSVKYNDLPKSVRDLIESDYNKDEITEIEFVDHVENGKFYDVEFKQKGKNKDVKITPGGKVI